LLAPGRFYSNNGHRVNHHHRCLCALDSNPDKKLVDRREAQKEPLLAVRNPNKSQVFHVMRPDGNRSLPHLVQTSLPSGKAYSVWGSNNHVPERTSDQQR
jgi:hypothetical protein